MWKKEEAERREQLFPPAGEWSRALTPPGLQSKGKAKERDHLLLVQTLLCVLLLAGVLALRQADAPAYQQLREGYHALMEQRGIEGEALLRFAAAAAEGVLQQVQEIAADEFELGPGADRTQPSEAASE
ncbi:MAG: hypothetical protein IJ484_09745, partial [Oscillospiraceae bacterium]|nr:hypothetical protein [Oscillospiraceae bacterium]